MAGSLLPQPKQMFQTDAWNPGVGYKIYTYVAGSSLTPKDTYQDAALTIFNTNPVIANARGEVVMYGTGIYRVILKDSLDNTVWDQDNISVPSSFADAVSTAIYAAFAAVGGSALIGWIRSATGAIATTVSAWMSRQPLSIFDFMTSAQIANVQSNTGTIDVSSAISLAISATPIGGTLLVPDGAYLLASSITISKSISIKSMSSVVRQTENGTVTASGVLWKYSGATQLMLIQRDNLYAQALNGIMIEGIDFRPTVDGAAARGIKFEANLGAIFGVRIKNCHFQYFGKSAAGAYSAGLGDVWDIVFENCSGVNHATSTEDMFSFYPAATGGAGATGGFNICFNDCYLQSRAPAFYAAKAGSLYMLNGIVDCVTAATFGTYSGSATNIIGTHYESYNLANTIAITAIGSNNVIRPGNVASFAIGAKLATTQTIVDSTFQSNTADIVIDAGATRVGTVIFGANLVITNNRYLNDSIYDVFIFANSDWTTWTPSLKFGGANVGMTGTFVGTITKVGRLITGDGQITLTAKGSSVGAATITGLPFTSVGYGSCAINFHSNMATAQTYECRTESATSTITLGSAGTAAGTVNLAETNFNNNSVLYFSFVYRM